jgi:hypothetical protein
MNRFSPRHRFADWPNIHVPKRAAGVYVIWDADRLIYCGMSGREFEKAVEAGRLRFGLTTRLASHLGASVVTSSAFMLRTVS